MAIAFDPNKPFEKMEFDPNQPFDKKDEPQVNPHDTVPTLERFGGGLYNTAVNGAMGLHDAVMNPSQTLSNIGNSLNSSNADYASGLYRAVRNIPIAGEAINNIVGSAKALYGDVTNSPEAGEAALNQYKQNIAQSDKQHALEHPLTDFIQKSAGLMGMAGAIPEQAAYMAMDAFHKSLDNGNNVGDAIKDAAHTGLLSALALKGGSIASKQLGSIPGKVGVSDDAIAAYKANPEMMNEAINAVKHPEAAPIPSELAPAADINAQQSPIPNFPTKDQLSMSLHPEDFESQGASIPSQSDMDLAKQFVAGNNQGKTFADYGKTLGGAAGVGIGGKLFGFEGAAGGGYLGSKIGSGLGGLVDSYGAPAVKTVLDAGIQLNKIAQTPYAGVLMKAAAEGPKSLAVTHYLLGQTDPGYQQAVNSP